MKFQYKKRWLSDIFRSKIYFGKQLSKMVISAVVTNFLLSSSGIALVGWCLILNWIDVCSERMYKMSILSVLRCHIVMLLIYNMVGYIYKNKNKITSHLGTEYHSQNKYLASNLYIFYIYRNFVHHIFSPKSFNRNSERAKGSWQIQYIVFFFSVCGDEIRLEEK